MTVFSSIIMLNIKKDKPKIFNLILGILLSVVIYYINYFSNLLGESEKLPIHRSYMDATDNINFIKLNWIG